MVRISSDALDRLHDYAYPGNVRELENLLERAIILSDGQVITQRELNLFPAAGTASSSLHAVKPSMSSLKDAANQAREDAERTLLVETLRKAGWNRVKAAQTLGIDYKTLRRKIRQYHLVPDEAQTP